MFVRTRQIYLFVLYTLHACYTATAAGMGQTVYGGEWAYGRPASYSPHGRDRSEQGSVHACFSEVSRRNCFTGQGDFYTSPTMFQSGLSCCSRKVDMLDFSRMEVGTCDFTVFINGDYNEVKPGVYKTGTFMAWCELDSVLANDAGSCPDQPTEAEKTRLSIIGTVFELYNSAIVSMNPRGPARDSACSNFFRRLSEDVAPRSAGNVTRRSPSRSDAAPVSGLYAVRFAQVLQGVVTVAAPTPFGPVQNGFMEFVAEAGFNEFAVPVTEADAAGQHIYNPYQYKFTFMKAAAGPFY